MSVIFPSRSGAVTPRWGENSTHPVTGKWAGAFAGIYTLPTNGTQIAAANFDLSGTTKLGTKLIDHSCFIPMLVLSLSRPGPLLLS